MGHRANSANFIRWIIRPYDMGAPGANGRMSHRANGRMGGWADGRIGADGPSGESGRMGHRANRANFIRWIIRPY